MKIKRVLMLTALLTAVILTVSSMAGCVNTKKDPEKTTEPVIVKTDAPVNDPTEVPATDVPATDAPTDEPTAAPTEVPTETPTEAPTEAPTSIPAGELAGYYKLIGGSENGTEYGAEEIAAMEALGLYCYLILNEDGTGVFDIFGDKYDIAWEGMQLTELESGDKVDFTVSGDTLTIVPGETTMIFQKSNELPPETGGEENDDKPTHTERAGYYVLSGGKESGTEIDADTIALMELLDLHAFAVLEPEGTGFINLYGEEHDIGWTDEVIYVAGQGSVPYTYDNDSFVMGIDESNYIIFTRSSDPAPERGQYVAEETGED